MCVTPSFSLVSAPTERFPAQRLDGESPDLPIINPHCSESAQGDAGRPVFFGTDDGFSIEQGAKSQKSNSEAG